MKSRMAIGLALIVTAVFAAWSHGGGRTANRPAAGPYVSTGTAGGYKVRVESFAKPAVDKSVLLNFDITRGGRAIRELAIVHTKPLHLIAVSKDLGHFLHLHPDVIGNGRLALNTKFPEGGRWVLYGDFTESGAANQIVRVPIDVAGEVAHGHELEKTSNEVCDEPTGTTVTLNMDPARAQVGENMMTFMLKDAEGRPVNDLEPVLGALGHLVIIKEGAATHKDYVHSHPMEQGSSAMAAMPCCVQFHVEFPSAGRYKAWVEFNRAGKKVLVSYVFDVIRSGSRRPEARPHH